MLAATIGVAAGLECADGTVDLHVFLYNGTVRDKDPYFWDGPSDTACRMTVESEDITKTLTSDILQNTNDPNYRMFFEFGCHPINSRFKMKCWDYDRGQPLERDSQIVLEADPFYLWPPTGVKQTLYDNRNSRYGFVYKFVYGSNLKPDGGEDEPETAQPAIAPAPAPAPAPEEPSRPDIDSDRGTAGSEDTPPGEPDQPSTKKKKKSSGRAFTDAVAIAIACALVVAAFCCGAFFFAKRSAKEAPPVAEVNGMELADVQVIAAKAIEVPASSEPTADEVEVPPIDAENPALPPAPLALGGTPV